MMNFSKVLRSRFVSRPADHSKEHFFSSHAQLAARSLQPHVVVLSGAPGTAKRDTLARLAKQGYAVVAPIVVVSQLTAQADATVQRDAALKSVLDQRESAWRDAIDAALPTVAKSRSNVLFVAQHPAIARFAHADRNGSADSVVSMDALRATLAAERARWNVSVLLLHTHAEIRRQRLEARAFTAASESERRVRLDWLREADAAHCDSVAQRFDDALVDAGGVFDGAVDATSVKQAVARLLSMLAVGKSAFGEQ